MTTEQIDLMPCPFCGVEPCMYDDANHSKACYISCQTDGCIGEMTWHETDTEAIAAWNRRASPVNTALAEDAARAHDLALEVERLRQRAEAAERERDTAKKYMAAYAECDRIGTEAYRDLADQHDELREKVSDMEAAWLVAHGVDLDSAMVAVQSVNATALTEARAARDTHAATAAVLSARDSIPDFDEYDDCTICEMGEGICIRCGREPEDE